MLTQTATGGLFQFFLIPLCLCQGVARAAVHVHNVTCQTPTYCTETCATCQTSTYCTETCATCQTPTYCTKTCATCQTPTYCTETCATCQTPTYCTETHADTHILYRDLCHLPDTHILYRDPCHLPDIPKYSTETHAACQTYPNTVQRPMPPARHTQILYRDPCRQPNIVQRPMPPARHTQKLYRDQRNSSNTAPLKEAKSPQLTSLQGAQQLRSESPTITITWHASHTRWTRFHHCHILQLASSTLPQKRFLL